MVILVQWCYGLAGLANHHSYLTWYFGRLWLANLYFFRYQTSYLVRGPG